MRGAISAAVYNQFIGYLELIHFAHEGVGNKNNKEKRDNVILAKKVTYLQFVCY